MVGYHSTGVREIELPVKGKYFGKRKIRAKIHEIRILPETGTITESEGNLLREFLRKKGIELTKEEIEKIRKIKHISTVDPREVDIPHPMDKDATYVYIHGGPTENALKTLTFLQLAALPIAAKVRHRDKFGVMNAIEQIVLPRIVEREQ